MRRIVVKENHPFRQFKDRVPRALMYPWTEAPSRGYEIETDDLRFELQDMVAIGREAFDLHVIVGHPVTFAVEKKTAFIKLDGRECRLRVLKSGRKKHVS
jgi:hypothetical protein